jgi:hypothetical protein
MSERTLEIRPPRFAATDWSLVAAAGSGGSADAVVDPRRIGRGSS